MSKTSVTSQKYSAVEVVDSLKLDNELVFTDLVMDGESLAITVSDSLTMSCTGAGGVTVQSVGPFITMTPANQTWFLAGFADGVADTDGSVYIGHDADGTPAPAVQTLFDSASSESRLGLFGATPVVQPDNAIAPAVIVTTGVGNSILDTDLINGYTLAQVVAALQATGILA